MDDDKIDASVYKYILKHTKKDQILLLLLTGLTMPLAYAMLELPKLIVNKALSGTNIPETVLGYRVDQIDYLFILCGAFFLLILINGGLTYVYSIYRGLIGEKMLKRFRLELYDRILRFPIPRFKQISQAEIIPLITAETQPLGNWIGNSFALPVFQGGLLITYLFFIFNQDIWLGLAAVLFYPPQLFIIPIIQKGINALDKDRVHAVREFSDNVGEAVSGIYDIHTNDMSRYEKGKVTNKLGEIYEIRLKIVMRWFLIRFLNLFLGQLTPLLFYAIGGYFVIKGELSIGALVAVLAAFKDLDTSWRDLLSFYQITENVRVRYGQIIEFFHPDNILSPKLQEKPSAHNPLTESTVQITQLSYTDELQAKSLDAINFKIDPGQHVGLYGESGSGCTELAHLITRLIHPTNGSIKISNQDINQLCESLLSDKIAYVDQQSFVFSGSVKHNLLYGLKSNANQDDDITLGVDTSELLKILELEKDVLHLGLNSRINPEHYPELTEVILTARTKLSGILEQDHYRGLVDNLSSDQYNTNLSVAENLIFGATIGDESIDECLNDKKLATIIEQTGLKDQLFHTGLRATKIMIDMFSGVADDSPMYAKFNFFQAKDLPEFEELAKLPDDVEMSSISIENINRVLSLSYKLTVARHRLGLITPEIQTLIIQTHKIIRKSLGEKNEKIEFFDKKLVAQHLTIQDNILFGRVAFEHANAQNKVVGLIMEVVESSEQTRQVIDIGLDYQVGVGGAKLTSKLRQKLTLARALMKNPEILVVNEATSVFEQNTEKTLIHNILQHMQNRTVIWVLNSTGSIDKFDRLILMEQGKITADGTASDISKLIN